MTVNTDIAVAAFGGAALVASSTIPSLFAFRTAKKTNSIVSGNGLGSVDKMLELVLGKLEQLETQIDLNGIHIATHVTNDEIAFTAFQECLAALPGAAFEQYVHDFVHEVRTQLAIVLGKEQLTMSEISNLRTLVAELGELKDRLQESSGPGSTTTMTTTLSSTTSSAPPETGPEGT